MIILSGCPQEQWWKLAAYDDQGRQQGRAVMKLARPGQDQGGSEGEMWIGQFLAVEDEYYEWWAGQTFPDGKVPVHFCIRPAQKCSEATLYRNPIHADVFRILPGSSAMSLAWLSDRHKEKIENTLPMPAEATLSGENAPVEDGNRGAGERRSCERWPRGN